MLKRMLACVLIVAFCAVPVSAQDYEPGDIVTVEGVGRFTIVRFVFRTLDTNQRRMITFPTYTGSLQGYLQTRYCDDPTLPVHARRETSIDGYQAWETRSSYVAHTLILGNGDALQTESATMYVSSGITIKVSANTCASVLPDN